MQSKALQNSRGCAGQRGWHSRTAAPSSHSQQCVLRRSTRVAANNSTGDAASPATGPSNNGTTSSSSSSSSSSPHMQDARSANATASPQSSASTSSSSRGGGSSSSGSSSGRQAVVIGGGWAGFGAALALAKAGARVTLLDAADHPGGLSSAFRTPGGQMVEPGIKGFWYQYSNISALVSELGIASPFTPFTRSSFWSPEGLQVESPIFQNLPRLPTPLGSFIHTAPLFRRLPLIDRISAAPLVQPLLEHDIDEATYAQYDARSAYELFRSAGVSRQLYDKFLAPMLLVTLFAPPTELSAAAALGALYYFALAHQPDFDVRWCKGPIGELIFSPLLTKLKNLGVQVLGGRRVQEILPARHLQDPGQGSAAPQNPRPAQQLPGLVVAKTSEGLVETHKADVIVLAAGIPALQQLLRQSPVLAAAQDLRGVMAVACSDVLAVRLWLDRKLQLATPSNVVAGFDEGVGGTIFQLDALQDMYKHEPGSVLEFDMYHAEPLLPLSDGEIVNRMLQTYLAPALPGGRSQASTLNPRDSSVLRFRNAVTRFSPGSHELLPGIVTSIPNVFVAGDCVKQGPGTHGCKGLSQEKAYVSGLQAGNRAAARLGLIPAARVIPVEPDEPHVAAAKELLRTQRQLSKLQTSLFSASSSGSGSGGDTSTGQQLGPSSSRRSRSSSSSAWLADGSNSERRARESHELQQLLREEVEEQVEQQKRQEQRVA